MSKKTITCIENDTNPDGSKVFFTKGKSYDVTDKEDQWEIHSDYGELLTVNKGSEHEKNFLAKFK